MFYEGPRFQLYLWSIAFLIGDYRFSYMEVDVER